MRYFTFFVVLGVLGCCFFAKKIVAQDSIRTISPTNSYVYKLISKVNSTDYQINVALPKDYNENDSIRYPVVYFLDGNIWFPLAVAEYNTMNKAGALQPLIIVAIGYQVPDFTYDIVHRTRDYTPSVMSEADSSMSKLYNCVVKSGGADSFLDVIENEIIPFVDKKFKTNTNKSLTGHSLGGLFATYALVKRPDLFQQYFIFSPSLWWDNDYMFQFLEKELPVSKNKKLVAHFAIGANETKRMVGDLKEFLRRFRKANSKAIETDYLKVCESDHFTALPTFVSFLFLHFTIRIEAD